MNLIIHVGLPKTGTTTIQYYLTKIGLEGGYIGKSSGEGVNEKSQTILHRFRQSAPVAPNYEVDELQLSQWVSDAKEYVSKTRSSKLIISDERLSSRGGGLRDRWPIGPITENYEMGVDRPLPEFISKLRQLWTCGEVKVVVTVRNQPEWIASLYAQRSYRIQRASQKDFEREVDEVLKHRGDFLDWNSLVRGLQCVLADGMLKVLFFEEINQSFFWDELSEFAELKSVQLVPDSSVRENVNSIGGMRWKIKQRARPDCSYMALLTPFSNRFWVKDLKKCAGNYVALMDNLLPIPGVGRGKEFVLRESIRGRILDRYELSNQELAKMVKRNDLSVLGYLKEKGV